jgi:integrase/recombinase XerD
MEYKEWLIRDGKSENTIKSYLIHLNEYRKWFQESFHYEVGKLFRENILDYISYMNIKKLNGKSINSKLAALCKYNKYLIEVGFQDSLVITKKDKIKVQNEYINPSTLTKDDVEIFRQTILENSNKRNFAIITLLAYSGLRITEALNIKLEDIDLTSMEILIRYGKGKKQRKVIFNDKIKNAIKEYIKEERIKKMNSDSEYLFISQKSEHLDRTSMNKVFRNYSKRITPHSLRHYFCSHALDNGWSTHEVALQVGHSNIHTTLMYTHPTLDNLKRKSNLL